MMTKHSLLMEQHSSQRVCTDETGGKVHSNSAGALPVCLVAKLEIQTGTQVSLQYIGHHHSSLPVLSIVLLCALLICEANTLSIVGRMAKGKAIKKQPDTWETVCQVTNTVLEVSKVQDLPHLTADDCMLGVLPPHQHRRSSLATGLIENVACAASGALHLYPTHHRHWHDHDRCVHLFKPVSLSSSSTNLVKQSVALPSSAVHSDLC